MDRRRALMSGLLGLALLAAAACAQPPAHADEGFTPTIIDNGRSRITAVVSRREDGFWIEGVVRRKPLVRGPMTGHIHVEIRSPRGAPVAAVDVPIEPARIPAGASPEAHFAARLPASPRPGDTITVRHRGDEGVRRFRESF